MRSQEHANTVVIRAPAKVNLYLEVLAKRADGYHDIETLMVAVTLFDDLEFMEKSSGELQLTCDHPNLSTGSENLVCKAAALLQQKTGCRRGARIQLHKRIPLAAGLAGGSTDAAAALSGLNELWRLGLTRTELQMLGAQIGSDVAFFLSPPAAWCTGRGECVTPVSLGARLHLVLVCPNIGLSTAEVYRGVSVPDKPTSGAAMGAAAAAGDIEEIGRQLHNRLQSVAEGLCPEVAAWRRRLEVFAPAGCLMSGSGSSLFALGRDRREAERIAQELRHGIDNEAQVFLVESCL